MSSEEQTAPSGWRRETCIGGMRAEDDTYGGGYKCDPCDHFIPIVHLDEFSDQPRPTCPQCGEQGLIGTIIMGRQSVTYLLSEEAEAEERDVA